MSEAFAASNVLRHCRGLTQPGKRRSGVPRGGHRARALPAGGRACAAGRPRAARHAPGRADLRHAPGLPHSRCRLRCQDKAWNRTQIPARFTLHCDASGSPGGNQFLIFGLVVGRLGQLVMVFCLFAHAMGAAAGARPCGADGHRPGRGAGVAAHSRRPAAAAQRRHHPPVRAACLCSPVTAQDTRSKHDHVDVSGQFWSAFLLAVRNSREQHKGFEGCATVRSVSLDWWYLEVVLLALSTCCHPAGACSARSAGSCAVSRPCQPTRRRPRARRLRRPRASLPAALPWLRLLGKRCQPSTSCYGYYSWPCPRKPSNVALQRAGVCGDNPTCQYA